jgi:hypothetical protein
VLHALLLKNGTVSLALTAALAGPAPATTGTNAAGYATPGTSDANPEPPANPSVTASAEAVSPSALSATEAPASAAQPEVPAPVVSPEAMAPSPTTGPSPQHAPPWADPAPTPEHLRPPRPPRDGRGLFIAAGVMGALNVALAAARLGLSLGESTAEREQARLVLTAGVMPVGLAAGIGLAAAGGHYRGRIDGYRTAFDHDPKLRALAFTGSGTVLLVMGAVAWASAWTPWHGDATLDGRGGGSLVVESVGSLLLMGGTGLLAYGVSWKRHTARYGRTLPLALRPAFAPGFAGLALGGRF